MAVDDLVPVLGVLLSRRNASKSEGNDRFYDKSCNASINALHTQRDAASAKKKKPKSAKSRVLPVRARRSE